MTQKYVGMRLGFSERSADIRIAQYETDARTPKRELLDNIADVLGVHPDALTVPDIDSLFGVMHTFFALEDRYDLRAEYDGSKGIIKIVPGYNYIISEDLAELVDSWAKQAEKYRAGGINEITIGIGLCEVRDYEKAYKYCKEEKVINEDEYQNKMQVNDSGIDVRNTNSSKQFLNIYDLDKDNLNIPVINGISDIKSRGVS